jgi:hypothetical protein
MTAYAQDNHSQRHNPCPKLLKILQLCPFSMAHLLQRSSLLRPARGLHLPLLPHRRPDPCEGSPCQWAAQPIARDGPEGRH